jgi:colicin import membrane protein
MSQESSALFSLQELSRMEEQRIRAAAEAEARARDAQERAARLAVEQAAEAREAVEREEAEARRAVERAAREEAARIDAMRRATIETARAAAEAQSQAFEAERQRIHDLEIERARESARGVYAKTATLSGLFGAAVVAGITMGLYFGIVGPRAEAARRGAMGEVASLDATIGELRARAVADEARLEAVTTDLAVARDENARLHGQIDAPARPPVPHVGHVLGTPPRTDRALDGLTTCPPGSKDPLCIR